MIASALTGLVRGVFGRPFYLAPKLHAMNVASGAVVVGFSAADEIEKLDRLKKAGSISDVEFAQLRAKLVS